MAPKEGDFSFIKDGLEQLCYADAWKTVSANQEFIDFVKNKPSSEPWMFNTSPVALAITNKLEYKDWHSGASLALTLRQIEYIYKNGWEAWVKDYK